MPSAANDDQPQAMPDIDLCLSGGGFRATLFHLGVILCLRDAGLLDRVKRIYSVSGGSITAAHALAHWDAYHDTADLMLTRNTDARNDLERAVHALVDFTRQDLRGAILREWALSYTYYIPYRVIRFLFPRSFVDSPTSLFEVAQSHRFTSLFRHVDTFLLRSAKSGDAMPSKPYFRADRLTRAVEWRFLATSLSSANAVAFTWNRAAYFESSSNWPFEDPGPRLVARVGEGLPLPPEYPVAFAVAASAAFPLLIPHAALNRRHVAGAATDDGIDRLTDGGVVDNLGIAVREAEQDPRSPRRLFVFDAGQPLTNTSSAPFSSVRSTIVRSIDLLMQRLGQFQASTQPTDVAAKIGLRIVNDDPRYHPEPHRGQLALLRTDFDAFSDAECWALVREGYECALDVLWNYEIDRLTDEGIAKLEAYDAATKFPRGGRYDADVRSSTGKQTVIWPRGRAESNKWLACVAVGGVVLLAFLFAIAYLGGLGINRYKLGRFWNAEDFEQAVNPRFESLEDGQVESIRSSIYSSSLSIPCDVPVERLTTVFFEPRMDATAIETIRGCNYLPAEDACKPLPLEKRPHYLKIQVIEIGETAPTDTKFRVRSVLSSGRAIPTFVAHIRNQQPNADWTWLLPDRASGAVQLTKCESEDWIVVVAIYTDPLASYAPDSMRDWTLVEVSDLANLGSIQYRFATGSVNASCELQHDSTLSVGPDGKLFLKAHRNAVSEHMRKDWESTINAAIERIVDSSSKLESSTSSIDKDLYGGDVTGTVALNVILADLKSLKSSMKTIAWATDASSAESFDVFYTVDFRYREASKTEAGGSGEASGNSDANSPTPSSP